MTKGLKVIDLYKIPGDKLTYTVRYLRDFAKKRGYPEFLKLYDVDGPSYLRIVRPDGKVLRLWGAIPPTSSRIAVAYADNKWLSYQLLGEIEGVKQPATMLVRDEVNVAKDFLNKYKPIVVKPVDGAHGNGISTEVDNEEQLEKAIKKAGKYCYSPGIILQEQLPVGLPELRIICIDFKYTVAMLRVPATVEGDGKRNLAELIDYENEFLRTAPYLSDRAFIDKEAALKFLGERVNYVPAKGEKVRVLSICNVGKGGTMEDMTEKIPAWQRELSEEIAKQFDLPVIGIDFYGDYIIEVNASPALYQPVRTSNATVCVDRYLDYLENI